MKRRIRIALAIDQSLCSAALLALLEAQPDFWVVGASSDGAYILELVRDLCPHILVSGATLSGASCAPLLHAVRTSCPSLQIVLLDPIEPADPLAEAIGAGCVTMLQSDTDPRTLLSLLRAVAGRDAGSCRPPERRADVAVRAPEAGSAAQLVAAPALGSLTGREQQILAMIAAGSSNQAMADCLRLSIATVGKHRANLMRKLDRHCAADLTRLAYAHGLLPQHSCPGTDGPGRQAERPGRLRAPAPPALQRLS